MNILKTTVAALVAGTLVGSACLPIRAMADGQQTAPIGSAEVAPASSGSLLALPLQLNLVGAAQRDVPANHTNCRAGHLYSQHDVVGDPESCIKGMATFGTGGSMVGGGTVTGVSP
jgi:hypothetical protein